MNQRAYIELEIIRESRVYKLLLPIGSQFSERHEVATEFAAGIIEMDAQDKRQRQEAQDAQDAQESELGLKTQESPVIEAEIV